jgi:pimeloyl-ACP methyl ester carboxylesterase
VPLTATFESFTPTHRAGAGPPLVCVHGFIDTWRTWELVLPRLEARHDVLALTLPGHAGGPPIHGPIDDQLLTGAVERAMDEAGFETAHLVGNSLGGFVALQLAQRGRARSVVALAPAGGWPERDGSVERLLDFQRTLSALARMTAPQAGAILADDAGRRRATALLAVNYRHIPVELLRHQWLAVAAAGGAGALVDYARHAAWTLDPERMTCPVRIIWGTEDRLLPWPRAAHRYRREWLPHADWVVLDDVGHCPQLDLPLETSELILGFTGA